MADRKRPGFVDTLRTGWRPAPKSASTSAKSSTTKSSKAKASKLKASASKSSKATAAAGASKTTARGKKTAPAPNMQERMEGLQGWMAEIERKQERMTRFGGIGVIVAIAAAGGALALGILNKQDAATKDDVDELTEQVDNLSAEIEQQTEKQLGKLNQSITGFEGRIQTLEQQQKADQADIAQLKSQKNAAPAVPTPTPAPTVPGATP
jgi:TolA-binding protein